MLMICHRNLTCIYILNPTKWTFACFISTKFFLLYQNKCWQLSLWVAILWVIKKNYVSFMFSTMDMNCFLPDQGQSRNSELRPKGQFCWKGACRCQWLSIHTKTSLDGPGLRQLLLWAAGRYEWSTWGMGARGREEKSKGEVWQSGSLGRDQSSLVCS